MVRKTSETPFLIAQSGPLEGQRWLIKNQLVIGRDNSCDVVVPDRQVSRQHARLSNSKAGVILEDMDSKNGTFHNNRRINTVVTLVEGDEVQIALAQDFIFLSSDATLPLEDLALEVICERCLRLDSGSRRVWLMDEELEPSLSILQFNLLQKLYQHPGEVVSRMDVIEAVWGVETEWVSEQALDALVRRLRDRLVEVDSSHDYIITVRGHGLRLENPSSD